MMMGSSASPISTPAPNVLLTADVSRVQKKTGPVTLAISDGRKTQALAWKVDFCSDAAVKPARLTHEYYGKKWVRVCARDQGSDKFVRMNVALDGIASLFGLTVTDLSIAGNAGKLDEILQTTLQSSPDCVPKSLVAVASTSSVNLDPQIYSAIVADLPNIKLKELEFKAITDFYACGRYLFERFREPQHLRKETTMPKLARSLVYVPQQLMQGMYILLKSHGGMSVVGTGSYNRVTIALHLDSGRIMAFRSGNMTDTSKYEIDINLRLMQMPQYFSAGVPVVYRAKKKLRRKDPADEDSEMVETEPEKVGYLCEFHEGGELFYHLNPDFKLPLSVEKMVEALRFMREIAEAVHVLHEVFHLVHLDLKPENIYLTRDRHIRIGDFGSTKSIGQIVEHGGTRGYMPPELVKACLVQNDKFVMYGLVEDDYVYRADPQSDVWSLACVMADFVVEEAFFHWNEQAEDNWIKIFNQEELEKAKEEIFTERKNPHNPQNLICRCLVLDPKLRPTMRQVAQELSRMETHYLSILEVASQKP